MIFWEKVLLKYPMKLQASEEDAEYLPIVFSEWFAATTKEKELSLHDYMTIVCGAFHQVKLGPTTTPTKTSP